MKLGKKVTAPKSGGIVRSPDRVSGPTWKVERIDGRVFYEYLSGELAGGVKRHEVTEEDFVAVSNGTMSDYDLLLKYQLS